MRGALERHDEILRSVIEAHGGYVFSTAGDAFAAAFGRADDAIGAAGQIQERLSGELWPDGVQLRVRVGVHTGEAQERGGDYFGPPLNRAARLMAAGCGEQVLVSSATAQVIESRGLVDLGEHRLKDLDRLERVFQLGNGAFPELRTVHVLQGNLRSDDSSFVGRTAELESVRDAISAASLVTLVGPGGMGKTRTAIEAASGVADRWSEGVWLVELAEVTEAGDVAAVTAATLGVRLQPDMSILESLTDSLVGSERLVVLDNCEHVIDSAAALVGALRSGAPSVSVLATSREPLGVRGEHLWAIGTLNESDALDLFVTRAREADAGFDGADDAAVVELCGRLDRVPLAIELAAARTRSMTISEITQRLANRFRLLRSSGRNVEKRQQTLAATVQWSYDLLSNTERALFDRLSVFVGGFTAGAVEVVCSDDVVVDSFDVVDLLESLVDKSVVHSDRSGAMTRFGQLETFRQFGEERLVERDEQQRWRDAHLGYVADLCATNQAVYETERCAEAVAVFETEWANIRAAFEWATQTGASDTADRILVAVSLYGFWASVDEVGIWAATLHEKSPGPVSAAVAAMMAGLLGDFASATSLADEALADAGPDDACRARAHMALHAVNNYSGRVEERVANLSEWTKLADRTKDLMSLATVGAMWQPDLATEGDPNEALEWARRTDELVESLANPVASSYAAMCSTLMHTHLDQFDDAAQQIERAYEWASVPGGSRLVASMLPLIEAPIWRARGDHQRYLQAMSDAFDNMVAVHNWFNVWAGAEQIGYELLRRGHPGQALPIIGYLRSHNIGLTRMRAERAEWNDQIVGIPGSDATLRRGADMDRTEMAAFIRAALDQELANNPVNESHPLDNTHIPSSEVTER